MKKCTHVKCFDFTKLGLVVHSLVSLTFLVMKFKLGALVPMSSWSSELP